MKRLKFFFSIVFGILSLHTTAYSGSPFAWDLQPVRIIKTTQNSIKLAYQGTCSAQFGGFLLRTDAPKELRIGVLLQRSHARCSQLTGMQHVIVPFLKASQYESIRSLSPLDEPAQLKVLPLQNLHSHRRGIQTDVQAIFTTHCGRQVGLFVRPETSGLRLGIVEGGESKNHCSRTTEILRISNLDLSHEPSLTLDPLETESQHAPYILKRVPVVLSKPTREHNEMHYELRFHRHCNEAPIGLVRQEEGPQSLSLAMLVAQYSSMQCPNETSEDIVSVWSDGFRAAPDVTVKTQIISHHNQGLRIARPLSYQWIANSKHPQLQVSSYESCVRNMGLVTFEAAEGVAVGILQELNAKPCNSAPEKVSYAYEWNRTADLQRDVKPLQLLGSH